MLDNAPLTYVSNSLVHGKGLFAEVPFLRGEVALNYALFPEIWYECSYEELSDDKKRNSGHIMINNERCITTSTETKFRYVNHSRTPSCDWDFKNRLLIANRLICHGEEITIDYRREPLPVGHNYPDWI
jgi:hypothetical protein